MAREGLELAHGDQLVIQESEEKTPKIWTRVGETLVLNRGLPSPEAMMRAASNYWLGKKKEVVVLFRCWDREEGEFEELLKFDLVHGVFQWGPRDAEKVFKLQTIEALDEMLVVLDNWTDTFSNEAIASPVCTHSMAREAFELAHGDQFVFQESEEKTPKIWTRVGETLLVTVCRELPANNLPTFADVDPSSRTAPSTR
ncbi:MAG: hypothetical protein M1826_006165 [Phylliscum demangeonii]|nr:MAG: hypothetical protein M1826_006165 [Phylliscum demangeonii]